MIELTRHNYLEDTLKIAEAVETANAALQSVATDSETLAGDGTDIDPLCVSDAVIASITAKADRVTDAIGGNFAGLDEHGNLTDSGVKAAAFASAAQGANADSALQAVASDPDVFSGNGTAQSPLGIIAPFMKGRTYDGAPITLKEDAVLFHARGTFIDRSIPAAIEITITPGAPTEQSHPGLVSGNYFVAPKDGRYTLATSTFRFPSISALTWAWVGVYDAGGASIYTLGTTLGSINAANGFFDSNGISATTYLEKNQKMAVAMFSNPGQSGVIPSGSYTYYSFTGIAMTREGGAQ